LGESGSGKSTLGRLIVRLLKPTEGKVLLEGKDIFSYGKEYTRKVSMVFQNPRDALNPRYSVWESVEEPLLVHGIKNRKEIIERVLLSVGVGKELWFRKTYQLSGGQRQRVAIARALVLNPLLLVADEPTSALDPISTSKIEELVVELKKRLTIVIVTHNMQQAARISDYTAFMFMGELVEFGATEKIFTKPDKKLTEDYITGRFG
jgi:ABC-type phosphate transport system ATPase subunit